VKKYRRGGALAAVLPDLFPTTRRMLADLLACERARRLGVPASRAAGLFLRKRAGLLWAGYLLTEEIPGASSLSRALAAFGGGGSSRECTGSDFRESAASFDQRHADDESPRSNVAGPGGSAGRRRAVENSDVVITAAGRAGTEDPRGSDATPLARRAIVLVRRMHDAGILHRDLNLGNLLAAGDDLYVIDLDGASLHEGLTEAQRFGNLSRLDRSYVKLFRERGPLSHEDRLGLLAVYCGGDAAMLRVFESRLPAHKRGLFLHGLLRRR
jgi:hypothetical protein